MTKFIAISGASTSGKTTLINSLSTYPELSNAIFSSSIHDIVWSELVDQGFFSEFKDVSTDPEYLCLYLIRMADYYNTYLEDYRDSDRLVILDECWIDLSIYTILNMWYNRSLKPLQEEILQKIHRYDERISRIYVTLPDDTHHPIDKFRLRGSINTFRANRQLELQYYDIAKRHFNNFIPIPSSDVSEASLFIINDLKNLGYV